MTYMFTFAIYIIYSKFCNVNMLKSSWPNRTRISYRMSVKCPIKSWYLGYYIYQTSDLFLCSLALELGWATCMGFARMGALILRMNFLWDVLRPRFFFACLLQCFLLVWLYTKYCVLYLLDCIVWGNRK